jgi:hypothetical protein
VRQALLRRQLGSVLCVLLIRADKLSRQTPDRCDQPVLDLGELRGSW